MPPTCHFLDAESRAINNRRKKLSYPIAPPARKSWGIVARVMHRALLARSRLRTARYAVPTFLDHHIITQRQKPLLLTPAIATLLALPFHGLHPHLIFHGGQLVKLPIKARRVVQMPAKQHSSCGATLLASNYSSRTSYMHVGG